jgi:plasmid maintenance system antidote protein VapI
LGLDPEMLLNMQTRYNMQVARADQRTQDRWNEVRKLCASFL